MAEPQKARLQDVLNYEPDTYFSADEIALIQSTFRDKKVMKVLRKAFLPSVGDPELPLEEMGNDFWLTGRDYSAIPDGEIKPIVLARQETLKYIMGGLIKLKMIANGQAVSADALAARRKKDSAQ